MQGATPFLKFTWISLSFVANIILSSVLIYLVKKFLKGLYKNLSFKTLKVYIITFSVITIVFLSTILSIYFKIELTAKIFSYTSMIFVIFNLISLLLMPFAVLIIKLFSIGEKKEEEIPVKNLSRRNFLKHTGYIFPLAAVSLTGNGFKEGFSETKFKKLNLFYKNLNPDFKHLKILHITDLHLGFFIGLSHLKEIVEKANKEDIDIVVVTGDFVDEYNLLDEGVKLLKQIKTKYGIYSCAGNHEYFRNIKPVIKKFTEEKIPYLINQGVTITINNSKLFIGGVDDFKKVKGDAKVKQDFYNNAVDRTLEYNKDSQFTLLMCHRPNPFDYCAKKNVDLVLSGHTHGGQFGLFGKSLFETKKNKYVWGHYTNKNSQLFVSSGAGHWFPFRIGCSTEVMIYILN